MRPLARDSVQPKPGRGSERRRDRNGYERGKGYTDRSLPYSVTFQPGDEFAKLRVSGRPLLGERERAVDELLAKSGFGPDTPILIDGRDVEVLPDTAGLTEFARHHARRLAGHPVAYLMKPGVGYGVARQIATHIELSGVEVQAFVDEGEAEAWLRTFTSE